MNKEKYETLTGNHLIDKGDNWLSFCPVHDEKTPSFFIHKETYQAHCFGCGTAGLLENVLSNKYMPAREVRRLLDIPAFKVTKEFEHGAVHSLYKNSDFSKAWLSGYKLIKNHPLLERRGFVDNTVLNFEGRWDSKERRIVFALRNKEGEVVGATGRTTINDEPKWKFYWNVAKGSLLYRDATYPSSEQIIIVEGIFEVLWLWQKGFTNIAAILGSHPSKYQIELIKQSCNSTILFLDNDEAGRRGQQKLYNALKGSLDVKYALYPEGSEGKDPQMLTKEELVTALLNRQTPVEYANYNR